MSPELPGEGPMAEIMSRIERCGDRRGPRTRNVSRAFSPVWVFVEGAGTGVRVDVDPLRACHGVEVADGTVDDDLDARGDPESSHERGLAPVDHPSAVAPRWCRSFAPPGQDSLLWEENPQDQSL